MTSFWKVYNEHHDCWLQIGNPPALVLPPQQLLACRSAHPRCVVARDTQATSTSDRYKPTTVLVVTSSQFHAALEADKAPYCC